ncbi:outer membrane beta-barrel protein [Salinibacter ruber]|uniref:outer membrane beta-barrel protein n=1 Tax=Salinibacter ruber TaxID=146919 RepID=UPI000E56DBDE|nr:outer membrane beta-barrel protein [Salinibacter ruber]
MDASTKQTAYSALLVLLLLGLSAAPAQAQFGIAAGANFDSVSDIQGAADAQDLQRTSTGYHIGAVYDFSIGPVNLRPGLFYRKVGSYDFSDVSGSNVDDLNVRAFEVPVDVRVTVFSFPFVSPYVVGGPNAFLPQGSEDSLDDNFEDVSFTFNVGVGTDISVPGVGLTLQPEFRYEFGASDYISGDFQIAGENFSPSDRQLSAYALRLNVLF